MTNTVTIHLPKNSEAIMVTPELEGILTAVLEEYVEHEHDKKLRAQIEGNSNITRQVSRLKKLHTAGKL